MNKQAFELLMKKLDNIDAHITELRDEVGIVSDKYNKLRIKVLGISAVVPFLVTGMTGKIDTPPKAVFEKAAEKIIKKDPKKPTD